MIIPDYLKEPSLKGHLYGKLTYQEDEDVFRISGEPLLLQYAKRIFPGAKVTRGGGGYIEFHRTRREMSDLNWLLMRFPVDLSQCRGIFEQERQGAIDQFNSRMSGSDKKRTKPPSNFLGKLYPYQETAVTFLNTNQRCLLSDGMGCVDGEALIPIHRAGRGFKIKLKDLYHKFHGMPSELGGRDWDLGIETKARSMCNGEMRLNRIVDVLDKGVRPALRMVLKSGKELRLTPDHEVLTTGGYVEAVKLNEGDAVLTNGKVICRLCGSHKNVSMGKYAKYPGVCRKCMYQRLRAKPSWGGGKSIDNDGYVRCSGQFDHPRANRSFQVYEHILVMEKHLGRYIGTNEIVHHKNENKQDNRLENLEVVTHSEHQRRHSRHINLNSGKNVCFIPKEDEVISLEPCGEVHVYDIVMEDPYRNFVANGVIVHNCGKTWSGLAAAATANEYPVLIVCQTHVQKQWQRMIGMLFDLPGYNSNNGTNPFDLATKKGEKLAPILKSRTPYKIPSTPFAITHYGLIQWWQKEIMSHGFKTIIFDEAQELRHTGTWKYSAASKFSERAERVWGLSVGGESTVELRGGCFGFGWVGPIEEAYSVVIQHGISEKNGVVLVWDLGIEARSLSGDRFGWSRVKRFYRHKCTSDVRMVFVGGSELLLTDDHSVFRAERNGGISCVRSDDLRAGDVVPFDDGNKWDEPGEQLVDVISVMRDNLRLQVVVDLSRVTREQIGANSQQWQKFRRSKVVGNRLPVKLFEQYRSILPEPSAVYLAPSRSPRLCDSKVRLSDAAYVLGFFIGDGWIDSQGRISFAVERQLEELFLAELRKLGFIHIEPKVLERPSGSVEIRVNSTILAMLFRNAFGGDRKSFEKRIPGEWIISWPRYARMELLRGMIDSDGTISKRYGRIYYSTTSFVLANQLLSLLRSVGVRGSLSTKEIAEGGVVDGKRIVGRRSSYSVNWSGYAMRGDFSGYRGCRRSLKWTEGKFLEGKVRRSRRVERPRFVYDLEMDGHPSFVANGVLVHNSGTPIFGFGSEIWSVMNVIDFHCLGSEEAFTREWCTGYGERIVADPKALNGHLSREGLMLRRRFTDPEVAIDLPKIVRHVEDLNYDELVYDKLIEVTRSKAKEYEEARFHMKGRLARDIERESRKATGVAKAPYVAEFIASLLEAGERPLVYAWHHDVHDIFQERLKKYKPSVFTGRQTTAQKDRSLRRFMNGDTDLGILSLRSAAGLDGLQHRATMCVFGELDWAPAVHSQAETRIARIGVDGSLPDIPSYYCVSSVGHDEVMLDVLGVKTGQFVGIMGDEPESYEEQKEAEERAAKRIELLVCKLKDEETCKKTSEPAKIKEELLSNCDRLNRLMKIWKLKDAKEKNKKKDER